MKQTIHITIDEEIVRKLREIDNYSSVINEQMTAYFNDLEGLNKGYLKEKQREIKQFMKEKRKELRLIEKKLNKITQKEKEILEIVHRCPECGKEMFVLRGIATCKCGISIELKGGEKQ